VPSVPTDGATVTPGQPDDAPDETEPATEAETDSVG
jgi:hypothetical protein